MKHHLSNGTIVFVVSLQTKKLHAILTFCPIFVVMSHCEQLLGSLLLPLDRNGKIETGPLTAYICVSEIVEGSQK